MRSIRHIIAAIVVACTTMCFAEGEPKVSILPWVESLNITDYQGNEVTLNHARIIDSLVDGAVPPYDSSYDGKRMELIAHFDKPINANSVVMYGLIYADGYDLIWAIIESITGERTRRVWKPIEIPRLAANQEITLIRTMLGSEFNVYYNKTKLTPTYGLSFVEWIQKFYCGIHFLTKEYMGITCTIDVVMIDMDTNVRTKIDSFSYKFTDGKYENDKTWFNARVGWYEKLPRDYKQAVNCSITDVEDSLGLKEFGKLSTDGEVHIDVTTNKFARRTRYEKKIVAEIAGGKDLVCQSFDSMRKSYESGVTDDPPYEKTMACALYDDNGVTNLMGLVRQGTTNTFVRLTPKQPLDLSGDTVKLAMTLRKNKREAYVCYQVNDIYFSYNDNVEIPVVCYEPRDRISTSGCAIVTDIYGEINNGGSVEFILK